MTSSQVPFDAPWSIASTPHLTDAFVAELNRRLLGHRVRLTRFATHSNPGILMRAAYAHMSSSNPVHITADRRFLRVPAGLGFDLPREWVYFQGHHYEAILEIYGDQISFRYPFVSDHQLHWAVGNIEVLRKSQ